MKMALEDRKIGILVNNERLNSIKYADDTIISQTVQKVYRHLCTVECSKQYGRDLNKTKYMIMSKTHIPFNKLIVDQQHIERVSS